MLIKLAPTPVLNPIPFETFKEAILESLIGKPKVQLDEIDSQRKIILLNTASKRNFDVFWNKFKYRSLTCSRIIRIKSKREKITTCELHDTESKICAFSVVLSIEMENQIGLNANTAEMEKRITITPNEQIQYFKTTTNYPELTVREDRITDKAVISLLQTAGRSVLPILIEEELGSSFKSIIAGCFFCEYNKAQYLVTAKHSLTDKSTGKLIDYLLGFEGLVFNEFYTIRRETLVEAGIKWSWVEFDDDTPELDLTICKIRPTEAFLVKSGIKPLYIDFNDDFPIRPGDAVYSFGFPFGQGMKITNEFLRDSLTGKKPVENIEQYSLIPQGLMGQFLSFSNQPSLELTSNMIAANGLSGSPLVYLYNGMIKLLGINIKAKYRKKEIIEGGEIKDKYKYVDKMISLHAGYLIKLMKMIEDREPITLDSAMLKKNHRNLQIANLEKGKWRTIA